LTQNPELFSAEMSNSKSPTPGGIGALRHDLLPSLVVFLVALPLCMGVAVASGVPVAAGLVTGIVGGLLVGLIAGAPLQVSGPAAGLTVIVFELVQRHGLETLGIAVLIAGGLQFAAGLCGLGQWFRAVSPAVIHGMLAGVGVLIFASQFHVMVDDKPKGSGLANIVTIPEAVRKGLPIPELKSREEREFRKQQLVDIGTLHDDQTRVRELVGESVPEDLAPEEAKTHAAELAPLAAQQQAVVEKLRRLSTNIEKSGLTNNGERGERLQTALAEAQRECQAALADLQDGKPLAARESQQAAAESLVAVLDALKNHDWAAKIGILTILVILLWKSFVPKKLQLVPAPLLAVVAGTAVATVLALPVLYVEVPDNLLADLHFPSPTVLLADWRVLLTSGAVIAAVASAETLLCATAVDGMHNGQRTRYDRELAAQGIGNMVCGILGALPMTGVIVRSSVNVEAGAKSRWSAVLHGVWLLVFVAFLSFLLRMIPISCLAAMLVYTGYKLIDFKAIRELWRVDRYEAGIYFVTVAVVVSVSLLEGVLVGIGLSALKLLFTFSRLSIVLEQASDSRVVLKLAGAATFIRLPQLAAALENVPAGAELHLDFEHLNYIDHACLELLTNWHKQHTSQGGALVIDWDSLHARFRGNGKHRVRAERKSSRTPGSEVN
jgi:MFS superfamily sulfate permease-like transporter